MKIAIASPDSGIVRRGAGAAWAARVDHHRGLIIAIGALVAMLVAWGALSAAPVGAYDIGSVISSATTLALAALGQTIVVLSGASICPRRQSCRSPTCSRCASCMARRFNNGRARR